MLLFVFLSPFLTYFSFLSMDYGLFNHLLSRAHEKLEYVIDLVECENNFSETFENGKSKWHT